VIISGLLDEVKIIEEHDIYVRVKTSVCDVCSKRFGGYHEAIIQIRAAGRRLTDGELRYIPSTVRDLIEDMRAKGNRSLFITDIGKEHGGVDFYLSDSGSALTISKKIQEQYGGEIKKSSKLIGMKDGRKIYRMTFLLRLLSYHEGEFVTIKDCIYYITSISRNKVHVFELTTWTNKVVDSKELQDGQVLGGKELVTEMIVVSETKNEVQVMNPETYEIIVIRKPKPIYFHSDKISTVKHDEQLFLFTEKFHNQ
jgi:nonsense-mediated mRNA decay protein 3